MASPQTANGYTRVANELLQAILRFPFSGPELRVVLWVARNIYGWSGRKQTLPTSVRALASEVGIPAATSGWALRGLCTRGVLIRMDTGALRLNKNYEEWLVRGTGQLKLTANTRAGRKAALETAAAPAPAKARRGAQDPRSFIKTPSLEEVKEYCLSRKSKVDPEKFWNHYEANGWVTGRNRNPITNWKSSVCYWERTTFAAVDQAAAAGKTCPICEVGRLPNANAIVCDKCGPVCRACGEQTAKLKVITRTDKTKTAVCAGGCRSAATPLSRAAIPESTRKMDAERTARFLAEQNRRKGR